MKPAKARRAWPFGLLVGFGIGFVLLLIGIVALFGVIVDERGAALRLIDAERESVEARAGPALRRELERRLASLPEEIEAALDDPLLPNADLVLVQDGTQLLPPRAGRVSSRARELLDTIDAGKAPSADADVKERLALASRLPASYLDWLAHRRSFVLYADLDLATTLVALERLQKADALDPERARALLRDGVGDANGVTRGYLPALLAARTRLSAEDFEHLLTRATVLGRHSLVRVDDVVARARERNEALPDPLLDMRSAGSCDLPSARGFVLQERWLVLCQGARVIGSRLPEGGLEALGATLGVPPDVELTTRDLEPRAGLQYLLAIDEIGVAASSPAWAEAGAEAERRFWFKAIPLAAVAVLAAIICGLALLLQRRRVAYVDLRSQLLAAVTHELKTPLASIRALAETLELRLANEPAAKDYPRRIVASSERLEFLVDNVLSFARLEREAWKPQLAPLAVADLAAWLAADPVTRAVRPVDFSAEVPPGLTLVGDADLVRLVLSNLLDNAAKYAVADRVRVRMIASQSTRGVSLALSDDGPGLGEHDPARLFEDFRRGRVEGVRGTGLGLSICKMVMALHRGTIEVATTSAAGTTFVATFPAAASSADYVGRPAFTPSTGS